MSENGRNVNVTLSETKHIPFLCNTYTAYSHI